MYRRRTCHSRQWYVMVCVYVYVRVRMRVFVHTCMYRISCVFVCLNLNSVSVVQKKSVFVYKFEQCLNLK